MRHTMEHFVAIHARPKTIVMPYHIVFKPDPPTVIRGKAVNKKA